MVRMFFFVLSFFRVALRQRRKEQEPSRTITYLSKRVTGRTSRILHRYRDHLLFLMIPEGIGYVADPALERLLTIIDIMTNTWIGLHKEEVNKDI